MLFGYNLPLSASKKYMYPFSVVTSQFSGSMTLSGCSSGKFTRRYPS